jgi:outer membrane biosynthesis protein TonB
MKKATWFVSILLLALSGPAFSQAGKLVAVTAEKEVDIANNDIAASRTVALAAAAREAVEKAYGSYVKVEELPNLRAVMTQTAAGLRYTILAEQQRGKKYWVKIQANVQIPAQYVLESGPDEREDLGENVNNFVQKYPQGEINWGTGIVLAYGKGTISAGDSSNAEENAARAAEVDAKAHLLEIINDIPVDDRIKTGDEKRMSFALEGFVQGAETVARSRTGTTVNVTVQAPLRGVKGLTVAILGYYTPEVGPPPAPPAEPATPETPKPPKPKPSTKPVPKPEPPKPQAEQPKAEATPEAKPKPETKPAPEKPELTEPASPTTEYTGVVIDARAVAISPAIFPKVQDTSKQDVYTVKETNKDDLQKRGMASYATVSRDVQISRLFPKALVIPVLYMPEGDAAKPKRRQGYKPLVVKAAGAEGANIKANLVISEEDARRLQELNKATGALKECRVVVVVSSEIGGLEGRLLTYNLAGRPDGD